MVHSTILPLLSAPPFPFPLPPPSPKCLLGLTAPGLSSSADPLLIYDKAVDGEEGFEGALDQFPHDFNPKEIQPEFSGL